MYRREHVVRDDVKACIYDKVRSTFENLVRVPSFAKFWGSFCNRAVPLPDRKMPWVQKWEHRCNFLLLNAALEQFDAPPLERRDRSAASIQPSSHY